jgi:MFS family permease
MVTLLFTLFTQAQYNMRPADNGWLFAYIGLISAIVQGGLLSRFIRWFGEKILVLVGLGLMIISFWGLPVVHSEQGLWLLSGLMALGNGLVTPVYNGLVSRYATPFQQGSVLGLMQGLGSLGRLMGPVIAGWLMAWQAMMNPRHQATYGEWAFHTACMMVLATGFIALFRLPATQRSPGNVESN